MNRHSVSLCLAFSLVVMVFCFSSCENFLKGSDLHASLEEEMKYANADEITVRVSAENNSGTTIPSNEVTKKVGYYFDISYTPVNQFCFKKWIAVYKSTGEDASDCVKFDNPYSMETKAIIQKKTNDIHIKPLYVVKNSVSYTIPSAGKEGVVRNMTIKISFAKAIDAESVTKDIVSVKEGYQAIVNNEIEFISNDASDKLKEFTVSPSGRVLTIELKDGFFYRQNSTVLVTISKDIKGTDGAPLEEDFTLRFYVGSTIDSLAPRIKSIAVGIDGADYSSIVPVQSFELLDSDLKRESIENIQNLSMKPLTRIVKKSLKLNIKAADITGYGTGQAVTEDESSVRNISCRFVCLYKFADGKLVKTNYSDEDYYDELSTVDYVPGGIKKEFLYPEYSLSGNPAPEGLYRVDVFATDINDNSGISEKYAKDYRNGYYSFYVLRDVSTEVEESNIRTPFIEAVNEKYLSDNGCVGLKIKENGAGISKIKIRISDSEGNDLSHCDLTEGKGIINIKYNSINSFASARNLEFESREKNGFTFAATAENNLTTGICSGYYFITGLGDNLNTGSEYDVKIETIDAAGFTTESEMKIIPDSKSPCFYGGENSSAETNGSIVLEKDYTFGNCRENVYPRPGSYGITGKDFWDSPEINNGDGVPVRWFYTNADNNGIFGIYLKTQFFDDIGIKKIKMSKIDSAPLSDSAFKNIKAIDIVKDGNDFIANTSGNRLGNEWFFSIGTYSFVIIDNAGNFSPAFTFTVVKDNSQPEVVSENGSDVNYLMTLEFDGTYSGGNSLFLKNRYSFDFDKTKKFYDWWDSSSHQVTSMWLRQVHLDGTDEQKRNAKIRFHVNRTADPSKEAMFGHNQYSSAPALNAKAERYNDSKPSRTNSGIAQYYVARVYKKWRKDNDSTVCFEPSFPPETNLNERFTGGHQLFSGSNENYKYDRSYAGNYSDKYFSNWQDYVSGTDIVVPIYKNMADNSVTYGYCPPITLCLKDNCGNIRTIAFTRPDWPEYAVFAFHFGPSVNSED